MVATKETKQQKETLKIFDLIEERAWDDVVEEIRASPEVAKSTLDAGSGSLLFSGASQANLVLHEACKCQPSVQAVGALLEAYPDAARIRGQWGFLPLHYAASAGASKEVVDLLLKAHPAGTRTRDEYDGVFPIHLACKWAANKDVLLAIMIVYPEGMYVRDNHGKTPKNHADNLLESDAKDAVLAELQKGPMLCACSRAAQGRVGDETESKLKGMAEAHTAHMKRLEERRTEERQAQRQTVDTLKTNLQNVTSEFAVFQQDLEDLKAESAALKSSKEALEEVLSNERSLHEKKITDVLATLETNRGDFTAKIAEKEDNITSLRDLVDEKQSEIESLQSKLKMTEENRDAFEKSTKEEKELTEKLRCKIEELSIYPGMIKAREATIKELEMRIQVHEKAEHALATNAVLLQKARNEAEHDLRVALAERDSIRVRKDEVQIDLSDAKRRIEAYKNRLVNLHGWVQTLNSDMESWNVDDFLPAGSVNSFTSSQRAPQEEKKDDDYTANHKYGLTRPETIKEPLADEPLQADEPLPTEEIVIVTD